MVSGSADFDAWYPRYNEYISDWLNEQVTSVSSALEELESSLKESNKKSISLIYDVFIATVIYKLFNGYNITALKKLTLKKLIKNFEIED